MAVAMHEIYAFVNKFVQISTIGLESSLNFTSDGKNVTASLNAHIGKLPHPQPEYTQPFYRHTKPSRIRRRKRRQDLRNQAARHDVDVSNFNSTDNTSSNENTLSNEPEQETSSIQMNTTFDENESDAPSNQLKTQMPINCIRHENGCRNMIYSYYNEYTAICESCSSYLAEKLKSSPYDHNLCPCCHKHSEGLPLSLCNECLEDVYDGGWCETGHGAWHLDRNSGNIVCIYLGFE